MRICEVIYGIFSLVIMKINEIFSPDGSGILAEIQRTAGRLVLEITNRRAPEKTSNFPAVHNS